MTDGVRVDCACGRVFHAPKSMGGGLANCPGCGKASEVRGGVEVAWVVVVAAGVLVVLGVTAGAWAAGGWIAGLVALGIGGAILAAAIAAS